MTNTSEETLIIPPVEQGNLWSRRVGMITVVTLGVAICVTVFFALFSLDNTPFQAKSPTANSLYPVGIADAAEPSGYAPPGPNALPGYARSYVQDFTGTSAPKGWQIFHGKPGGDPGGQFATNHVVFADGMLQLNTWMDPRYQDRWITGGLCQCGVAKTYGAYFVRSRITRAGPNEVELLWPESNQWPPEVDFNENGGSAVESSSTVHFGPINQIDQRHVDINMLQWHTWGVIWTPKSLTYVVDGQTWATITIPSEIPDVPMTLNIQQLQQCDEHQECPTAPTTMEVDWVAEYSLK
ncbi:MAG: glycoside hydrolase family 16 protein [Acidimicrobiales bacterium]